MTSPSALAPSPSPAANSFAVVGLDPIEADRLRSLGGPTYVADTHPGYPCRQCLHDAQVGDELLLVSHDPFATSSPYRCASPIFLHRDACPPYADSARLPAQLTSRLLSVRGFDDAAMMLDAAVVDGTELDATVQRMFGNDDITALHVHNAVRGCFAARIDRVDATG
jgi:hypothetical protein